MDNDKIYICIDNTDDISVTTDNGDSISVKADNIIYIEPKLQNKDVVAEKVDIIVKPDLNFAGLSSVKVLGVTKEIDNNLKPENIRQGVEILGVQGNLAPDKPDQNKAVIPTKERQIVSADIGYELANAIVEPIPDEYIIPEGTTLIDENGIHNVSEFKDAIVNVQPSLQSKVVTPTKSSQSVTPDNEYDGLSDVVINPIPEEYIIPSGELKVTENNTYDVTEYKTVSVDVPEGGDYDVQSVLLTDGPQKTQKIVITTVAGAEKPKDMLQTRVDGDNSCKYLFYYYGGTSLDISRLDTSNSTNMYQMFGNCAFLQTLDLSKLNTNKVTDMSNMFYSCSNLTNLDVSKFDTTNATTMASMFSNCSKTTVLNLSNFNTVNVKNMSSMFSGCRSLTNLDISNFNTSKVTNMSSMFNGCSSLTNLDISNFDTSKVTNMGSMLSSCKQLKSIIGEINLLNVTNVSSMFTYAIELIDITLKNIKLSIE
jgi:surface protein